MKRRQFCKILGVSSLFPISSVHAEDTPYESAAKYLEARNGHALLIYKNRELLCEKYFNDYQAETPHRLASGTKSFCAALAILAQQQKFLKWDEAVSETITEWKSDPGLSKITIHQLLTLTSGLSAGRKGAVPDYADAIQVKLTHSPGTQFEYGPIPFQVFGDVMRRKLVKRGETIEGYMKQNLFNPLGMEIGYWRKGLDGNPHLPSGIYLTAREWAKYGLLLADSGSWKGNQILGPKLLQECYQGTQVQPRYGRTFWLNNSDKGPKDLVMAAGAGKQKLYIVPSARLVIVQFAETNGRQYAEADFLKKLPKDLFKPVE